MQLPRKVNFRRSGIKAVFSTCTFPNRHQVLDADGSGSDALNQYYLCPKPDILHHPCLHTSFSAFNCLKYLRSLALRDVKGVTGQVLECILSHLPVLERLLVVHPSTLSQLRVIDPSIALKYLQITYYLSARIEICDVNLVSFIYNGNEINLLLRNVPQLVEVSISAWSVSLEQCNFQPEVFRLSGFLLKEGKHVFPTYVNLKHLELGLKEFDSCCLLQSASFMWASPYLHKLVLKLATYISPNYSSEKEEIKQAPKYSHECLKVVEVEGYHGRTSDLELIRYLIEN